MKIKTLVIGLSSLLLASCASTPSVQVSPQPAWSLSDAAIQNPESAYYRAEDKALYVSNVAGEPTKKDGKGWITRIDAATGKILSARWVSGLNAPKGIRSSGDTLWVSDIDQVVKISIPSAKVLKKIRIKGAKFLNDIAIGPEDEVYVSDMATGLIHVIRKDRPSVFAKNGDGQLPNGLLIQDGQLVANTWGSGMKPDFNTEVLGGLYRYNLQTAERTPITTAPLGNLDGMEVDGAGNYWVSDWMNGKIYQVDNVGNPTLILSGKSGTADIGFVPEINLLVVPQMTESRLDAYSVRQK